MTNYKYDANGNYIGYKIHAKNISSSGVLRGTICNMKYPDQDYADATHEVTCLKCLNRLASIETAKAKCAAEKAAADAAHAEYWAAKEQPAAEQSEIKPAPKMNTFNHNGFQVTVFNTYDGNKMFITDADGNQVWAHKFTGDARDQAARVIAAHVAEAETVETPETVEAFAPASETKAAERRLVPAEILAFRNSIKVGEVLRRRSDYAYCQITSVPESSNAFADISFIHVAKDKNGVWQPISISPGSGALVGTSAGFALPASHFERIETFAPATAFRLAAQQALMVKMIENSITAPSWLNAFAKAETELTENKNIKFERGVLTMISRGSGNRYVIEENDVCQCRAFEKGVPCFHRSIRAILANLAVNAKTNVVTGNFGKPEPVRFTDECSCIFNFDDKFTEFYCPKHEAEMMECSSARDYYEAFAA